MIQNLRGLACSACLTALVAIATVAVLVLVSNNGKQTTSNASKTGAKIENRICKSCVFPAIDQRPAKRIVCKEKPTGCAIRHTL